MITYKKGDKLICKDTIKDTDGKVRFIKDKVYEINADADEKGRYGFTDESGKLTRWGTKWFQLVGEPKQTSIVGMNTNSQINKRGPHKCTCSFYEVIVVTGCTCNGL